MQQTIRKFLFDLLLWIKVVYLQTRGSSNNRLSEEYLRANLALFSFMLFGIQDSNSEAQLSDTSAFPL